MKNQKILSQIAPVGELTAKVHCLNPSSCTTNPKIRQLDGFNHIALGLGVRDV